MARLGDICTIYSGTGFPVQYQGTAEGQYPFYKVGDIAKNVTAGNKFLVFCENYVEADIVKIIKGTVLPSRTVVFAKIGEAVKLNRRAITSCECLIDNNAMGIAPNESVITLDYFFHYMCSLRLETLAEATTVPSVKKSLIEKLDIPLPSLLEQEKISTVLNKVSELIALRKEQLAKLDQLVKSRFIELFGECDERKRLEEIATLITKGASPKWQGVDYCEEGTLFVTSENVREGYLDLSKRKYLDNRINEIQPRSMLKRNDILINIVGASIGRAAVYDCDEVANINQAVALVRVDYSQINQTYLMTFLNSPQAIEMYGKMKKGGARDNLSLQNIADLQIPVASIELQKQFATFVEQTDKSKLVIQQSLDKLELLKKSLMQEYFG